MVLKLLHQGPLEWLTSVPNLISFYQAVQELLVGDKQTGDLISLITIFHNRLKTIDNCVMTENCICQRIYWYVYHLPQHHISNA
jgi:hypothetical protein